MLVSNLVRLLAHGPDRVEKLLLMDAGLRVAYRISGGNRAPGEARRIISRELGRLVGTRRTEDLKLLVTELVNGRLRDRHDPRPTRPGTSEPMVLSVEAEGVIRCSVADEGPAELPSEWSMRILDLLATRWGVSRDRDSTRLWFEAELTPPQGTVP